MRLLALALVVLLTGCSTIGVPVKRNFPQAPELLMKECPDLKLVEKGTTKLSTVVDTVVTNYGQYQECQIQVETWMEWYKTQKQVFEEAN